MADKDKTAAEPGTVKILKPENRGLLLDVVTLIANVFLMRELSTRFFDLIRASSDGDEFAAVVVFIFFASLCVLAPAGAVLKRWHFHQRLKAQGKSAFEPEGGCLFHPILYFCLSVLIFSIFNALLFDLIFGESELEGSVFLPVFFGGIALVMVNTFLVYRYFTPPKREPRTQFMRAPFSALLGDICIFLNMLFFQLLWNGIASTPYGPPTGVSDLLGRLFFVTFAAMLLYFPPRILYLAEDIQKPRTWIMILLANSPLIVRMLFGI